MQLESRRFLLCSVLIIGTAVLWLIGDGATTQYWQSSDRACLVLGAGSPVCSVIAAVAHRVAHGLVGILRNQQAAVSALPKRANATEALAAERKHS